MNDEEVTELKLFLERLFSLHCVRLSPGLKRSLVMAFVQFGEKVREKQHGEKVKAVTQAKLIERHYRGGADEQL